MLNAAEWQAVRLTLLVATVAVICSFAPLAVAVAWLLAKQNSLGKFLLETIC